MFGAINKQTACDALTRAQKKLGFSPAKRSTAHRKCMTNWSGAALAAGKRKKHAESKVKSSCPKRVFQLVRSRSGAKDSVIREWQGRSCNPKYGRHDVVLIKFKGRGTKRKRGK